MEKCDHTNKITYFYRKGALTSVPHSLQCRFTSVFKNLNQSQMGVSVPINELEFIINNSLEINKKQRKIKC